MWGWESEPIDGVDIVHLHLGGTRWDRDISNIGWQKCSERRDGPLSPKLVVIHHTCVVFKEEILPVKKSSGVQPVFDKQPKKDLMLKLTASFPEPFHSRDGGMFFNDLQVSMGYNEGFGTCRISQEIRRIITLQRLHKIYHNLELIISFNSQRQVEQRREILHCQDLL